MAIVRSGRTMYKAGYRGTCGSCGGVINVGEYIRLGADRAKGYVHVECPANPRPAPQRTGGGVEQKPFTAKYNGKRPCPICHGPIIAGTPCLFRGRGDDKVILHYGCRNGAPKTSMPRGVDDGEELRRAQQIDFPHKTEASQWTFDAATRTAITEASTIGIPAGTVPNSISIYGKGVTTILTVEKVLDHETIYSNGGKNLVAKVLNT